MSLPCLKPSHGFPLPLKQFAETCPRTWRLCRPWLHIQPRLRPLLLKHTKCSALQGALWDLPLLGPKDCALWITSSLSTPPLPSQVILHHAIIYLCHHTEYHLHLFCYILMGLLSITPVRLCALSCLIHSCILHQLGTISNKHELNK